MSDSQPFWLFLPSVPPPPGVTANLKNPESLQRWDVLTQSVCLTVATTLVAIRVYTKARVLKSLGWDDYTAVVALAGLITYAVLFLVEDGHGNGRHLWNVRVIDLIAYLKLVNGSQIVYTVTILATKISILLLYLRIFPRPHRSRILIHVLLWFNVVKYTVGVPLEIFQCTPREKMWLPWIEGTCIDQVGLQLSSAAFNSFSDVLIFIFPLATVRNLNIQRKKKIGVMIIFGMGFLACLSSIIRVAVLAHKSRQVLLLDVTWAWYSLDLWTSAEITCGLICGCLPALPAFIRHLRGKPTSQRSSSSPPSYPRKLPVNHSDGGRSGTSWDELKNLESPPVVNDDGRRGRGEDEYHAWQGRPARMDSLRGFGGVEYPKAVVPRVHVYRQ